MLKSVIVNCLAAAVLLAIIGAGRTSEAACPSDAAMRSLAEQILAGEPAKAPDVATIQDGLCAQAKVLTHLEQHWGAPIGYKAGLTSTAAQERFGVSEPVRGVLLKDMMLRDGDQLPARFGARPLFEADLIVVVGDAGINAARTPAEVLDHLSVVHPFIELPDLVVAEGETLNGPVITAINVGARHGILGNAIPVEKTDAFLASLAKMSVRVTDETGKELAKAPGAAVLG